MDDTMFANLSQGLSSGPNNVSVINNSNMIAEPAQVMVLVPNTRALAAETKLSTLKYSILAIVLSILVVASIYIYFLMRRKAAMYKGTALPSVQQEDPLEPIVEPVMPAVPVDDIVSIIGPIPVWTVKDSDDSTEARVDESSSRILNLVKSREQFSKDLESTITILNSK